MAGNKVSFAHKDTVETSLNFGEGHGEIVGIRSVVHQFPAARATGIQQDPATMIEVSIQRTSPDGKPTDDDPILEYFGCGALAKFHPGRADDANDNEIEDQGDRLGADGNCLWSDGSQLNRRSKWVMFLDSLEKAGFKAEILANGFLPDLVGLKALFASKKLPREADKTYTRDPEVLEVKNITHRPYETAAKGKKGNAATTTSTGKGAAKAAAASADATASAAADVAAGEVDGEIGLLGVQILQEIGKKMAGQTLDKAKVPSKLFTILAKGVTGGEPVKTELHKPVQDLFKNDAWLTETCADLELEFADGKITFPKAA